MLGNTSKTEFAPDCAWKIRPPTGTLVSVNGEVGQIKGVADDGDVVVELTRGDWAKTSEFQVLFDWFPSGGTKLSSSVRS